MPNDLAANHLGCALTPSLKPIDAPPSFQAAGSPGVPIAMPSLTRSGRADLPIAQRWTVPNRSAISGWDMSPRDRYARSDRPPHNHV